MNIVIVDYGVGNTHSVVAAIYKLGLNVIVDNDGSKIKNASKIVIPGVAAFGTGIDNLQKTEQFNEIQKSFKKGQSIFGFCLGAQMFLEESDESPGKSGFNFVSGKVVQLEGKGYRVPNQGWNIVQRTSPTSRIPIKENSFFYFSHKFKMEILEDSKVDILGEIGSETILAAFEYENLIGTQFHPELSGVTGLHFLENLLV